MDDTPLEAKNTEPKAPPYRKLMRETTLCEYVDMSAGTIDTLIRRGEFPAPFRLSASGRGKAWFVEDVDAWIAERHKGPRIVVPPRKG